MGHANDESTQGPASGKLPWFVRVLRRLLPGDRRRSEGAGTGRLQRTLDALSGEGGAGFDTMSAARALDRPADGVMVQVLLSHRFWEWQPGIYDMVGFAGALRFAAEAGAMGGPEVEAWLIDMAECENLKMRLVGCVGLAFRGDTCVLGPLIEALADPDPGLRRVAATALSKMRASAIPALPALYQRVECETHPEVRPAIRKAVVEIGRTLEGVPTELEAAEGPHGRGTEPETAPTPAGRGTEPEAMPE